MNVTIQNFLSKANDNSKRHFNFGDLLTKAKYLSDHPRTFIDKKNEMTIGSKMHSCIHDISFDKRRK